VFAAIVKFDVSTSVKVKEVKEVILDEELDAKSIFFKSKLFDLLDISDEFTSI
jgi:hypothetical protein